MSKEGQALVAFLDNIMGCGTQVKIGKSVVKDATKQEMETCCEKYACIECPILQRCSMAEGLYS